MSTTDGAARLRKGVAFSDDTKCIQCGTGTLVCPQYAIAVVATT